MGHPLEAEFLRELSSRYILTLRDRDFSSSIDLLPCEEVSDASPHVRYINQSGFRHTDFHSRYFSITHTVHWLQRYLFPIRRCLRKLQSSLRG